MMLITCWRISLIILIFYELHRIQLIFNLNSPAREVQSLELEPNATNSSLKMQVALQRLQELQSFRLRVPVCLSKG